MSIGSRLTISAEDAKDPEKLARVINAVLIDHDQRIGVLEAMPGVYMPQTIEFLTPKAVPAFRVAPFPIRVALPDGITPDGVVIGSLVSLSRLSATPVVARDLQFEVRPGGGGLFIDFIPGLVADKRYLLRLVVFHG